MVRKYLKHKPQTDHFCYLITILKHPPICQNNHSQVLVIISVKIIESTVFPSIEGTIESDSEYELNNDIRFILDFCWARS